jgi:hypothetical protein
MAYVLEAAADVGDAIAELLEVEVTREEFGVEVGVTVDEEAEENEDEREVEDNVIVVVVEVVVVVRIITGSAEPIELSAPLLLEKENGVGKVNGLD